MLTSLFYLSEKGNTYLYDDQYRLSMLVHPALVNAYKRKADVNPYYLRKYEYLKSKGFFSSNLIEMKTEIGETEIKNSIIRAEQIVFEVTESCNLNCVYCIQGSLYSKEKAKNNNADIRSALKLLSRILDLKSKNDKSNLTISFYGGEPLLNMTFIKQVVNFISEFNIKKKFNITYSLTTNATLLHKYIDFLIENKFKILVSLDGNQRNNSYRVFRKDNKDSFSQVICNIDAIQKNYPTFFTKNVSFNAVLNDRSSVSDIYGFIYGRYKKIPRISEIVIKDISKNKKEEFNKIYTSKIMSEKRFLNDSSKLKAIMHEQLLIFWECAYFIKYYSINSYISDIQSLLHKEVFYPTNTCLPFSKKIFLTTKNKMLPCEKIDHKFSFGEIEDDVKFDIHQIAQQFSEYYKRLSKKCKYCYVHKFCGICMFSLQNLDTDMVECHNFHGKKEMQSKLSNIFSFLEENPQDLNTILKNVIISS